MSIHRCLYIFAGLGALPLALSGCGSSRDCIYGDEGDFNSSSRANSYQFVQGCGVVGTDTDPSTDGRAFDPRSPRVQLGGTVTARTDTIPGAGKLPGDASVFARTGVLAPPDGSWSTTFSNVLSTASGTASAREYFTVPLLAGVSIPVKTLGVPIDNLSVEAFGGGQIKRRQLGLAYTESGFGASGGLSGSQTWTDIDPAVGAGLQYKIATVSGMPISIGPNVTFDFRPQHSLTLPSANFPTVSYTLYQPREVDVSAGLTLNIDLP